MPANWKIFKGICILNWILIFPVVFYLAYYYAGHLVGLGPQLFHLVFLSFLVMLTLMVISSVYHFIKTRSVVIVDEHPANFSIRTSTFFFIVAIISILLLSAFSIYGIQEEFFSDKQDDNDNTGKYVLLYLFVIITLNTYIAIMQYRILRIATKRKKEALGSMIENIGKVDDLL